MASTTIHSLAYKVTADVANFEKGMVATRKELSQAKRLTQEFLTQAEKLQQKTTELDALLRKESISQATYNRALARYKSEAAGVVAANKSMGISLKGIAAGFGTIMGLRAGVSFLGAGLDRLDAQQDAHGGSILKSISTSNSNTGSKVAELNATEAEEFLSTMRKNVGLSQRDMGRAKEFFKELGYDAQTLTKLGLAPVNEQLTRLVDDINKIENSGDRALIIEKIFGTNAASVIDYIERGNTGIAEMAAEIEKMGGLQGDHADEISAAAEAWKEVGLKWETTGNKIVTEYAPSLIQAADAVKAAVDAVMMVPGFVKRTGDSIGQGLWDANQFARTTYEHIPERFRNPTDEIQIRSFIDQRKHWTGNNLNALTDAEYDRVNRKQEDQRLEDLLFQMLAEARTQTELQRKAAMEGN